MKQRQWTIYFVTVSKICSLHSQKKLTDARLSPDLRTQIQFGRLKDPTFSLLATPMIPNTKKLNNIFIPYPFPKFSVKLH